MAIVKVELEEPVSGKSLKFFLLHEIFLTASFRTEKADRSSI
jgi:hypothetical protein